MYLCRDSGEPLFVVTQLCEPEAHNVGKRVPQDCLSIPSDPRQTLKQEPERVQVGGVSIPDSSNIQERLAYHHR